MQFIYKINLMSNNINFSMNFFPNGMAFSNTDGRFKLGLSVLQKYNFINKDINFTDSFSINRPIAQAESILNCLHELQNYGFVNAAEAERILNPIIAQQRHVRMEL